MNDPCSNNQLKHDVIEISHSTVAELQTLVFM